MTNIIKPTDKRILRKKPAADLSQFRGFTFPPELAARFDAWKEAHPKQASPAVAALVDNWLKEQGY